MNRVILIGRLTRDPELRTTPTNLSVATFSLAVNRPYNSEKERQEADFIGCIVWRKQAENLVKYCKKGSQVAVDGRIQTRNYTTQDGSNKYITEVLCESITFLGSKTNQEPKTASDSDIEQAVNNMTKTEEDPFKDFGEEVVIDESDLPF